MGRRILLDCGKWNLIRGSGAFIITSDEELLAVARDPYSYRQKSFQKSFSEVCEEIKKSGGKIIGVSYDFFFGGKERRFYPPDPECINAYKVLYNVAQNYGLLFTASIISPLDLGPAYVRKYEDIGYWYQYREIKPGEDGNFKITLPLQKVWFHNKGPCRLTLEKVIGYRYKEEKFNDEYFYVPKDNIKLIDDTIEYQLISDSEITYNSGYSKAEILVKGNVSDITEVEAILIVLIYKAEEMDYFSSKCEAFIKAVIDSYKDAGIILSGFYSDEMHIQFDWDLSAHFGKTEIQARYITPNLIREFCERYGEEFEDFPKYLVYFAHHMDDNFKNWPIQHIIEPSNNGIYKTWLLRKNYFALLNERVVDIYVKALKYAERKFETIQYTQAHATWQESPTCDQYDEDYSFGKPLRENISRYDYGPHYIASSSVREGVSACYDYFKWGEFLTGEGNDFPEGGNLDRNYYGMAMAVSFANINRFPVTYCGTWGSPREATERFLNVASAYGVANSLENIVRYVQDFQTRYTSVLMLYPLELLYANDRFGSWMVQYGYADYITEEMLLKHSSLTTDGKLKIYDKTYNTIVVLFQPIIREKTLAFLKDFIDLGGNVIWMSIPAMLSPTGRDIYSKWCSLFGIDRESKVKEGFYPGRRVNFIKELEGVEPMTIPTSLFPDKVYIVKPNNVQIVAELEGVPIGFIRKEKGISAYFGFRIRDNQSEKVFTLFQILEKLGCYEEFEILSHCTPYLFTQFPNGSVSIARHYYELKEDWSGEFFRKEEKWIDYPPTWITLNNQKIRSHTISYKGDKVMAYNIDKEGKLFGFAGYSTTGIKIDNIEYRFVNKPGDLLFAKIHPSRLLPGITQCWIVYSTVSGRFRFPIELKGIERVGVLDNTFTSIEEELTLESKESIVISESLKGKFICLL
ncbi:MAG: hypothetical protein ACPL1I_06110 [bacterium]